MDVNAVNVVDAPVRSLAGVGAMPVASYPGGALVGARVRELACDAATQCAAILALRRRLGTEVGLTCMDLSVEAEAFGAEVAMTDDEVPAVVGRRIVDAAGAAGLRVPDVGEARTSVQLEVVRRLKASREVPWIVAGLTGPFSLASRLLGVSETMTLTMDAPDLVQAVVRKAATFLEAYACALLAAGARAVFMAEPTAGLIAPVALAVFSAPYVREIAKTVERRGGTLILHNCAARLVHLPAILGIGVRHLHFGAPMDLAQALTRVPEGVVVFGNLDPAGVFVNGTPGSVAEATRKLCQRLGAHRNWVPSSGCDLPAGVAVEKLEAFFEAARERVLL